MYLVNIKSKFYNSFNNKLIRFSNTHYSIFHSIFVFIAYFLNNFLYYCYYHVVTNTFLTTISCLIRVYKLNIPFVTKCLELAVSYFAVYSWLYKYSGKFDGYSFHHVFYYRYGIINFRDMLSRVLGTLSSAALFGWIAHTYFGGNNNNYSVELKKNLYKMIESNGSGTILEYLFLSSFEKGSRHEFFKRLASRLTFLNAFKYEDRQFDIMEKYVSLLFECFIVELTFSLFVYVLSSLILKSKGSSKSNLALNSFVRNAFLTCGNQFLIKVNGCITLDENKAMIFYFKQRDKSFLFVRLSANLIGALIIPILVPMPKIMNLHEYRELYPNSKLDKGENVLEIKEGYYVINKNRTIPEVYNSPWPNTIMGRLFSNFESSVYNKLKTQ